MAVSLIDELLNAFDQQKKNNDSVTQYNFGIGHPSFRLNLPKALILKCVQQHLHDEENDAHYRESMDYALNEGSWYFRSNLADWLNKLNSLNTDASLQQFEPVYGSNMVLTTGASQSMELLLIHLKQLKKKHNQHCKNIVLIEDPSYYLVPNIVQHIGADCKILPIPFTHDGKETTLDFAFLEAVLRRYSDDIIAMYSIPTHHNPLGISYTLSEKQKLIALCRRYKLHLIADEVYNLLSFDDNAVMVPFMASMEHTLYAQHNEDGKEENENEDTFYCHSVSSLSKIIGPGFRIGWIYSANEQLLERVSSHGSIKSGGCMAQFTPSLLTYLFDDSEQNEMTKHLLSVRKQLETNCNALCDIIEEKDTRNMVRFRRPAGGYFMWLQLPADKIKVVADEQCKVKYFKGLDLSSTFGPISKDIQFVEVDMDGHQQRLQQRQEYFATCVRFCFAYLSEQEIREGALEFMQCIYA